MTMQRRQFLKWVAAAASAFSLLPSAAFAAKDPIGRAERLDAAEFNAARKFVPTRFGRVALVERGAGKAALFLHGFSLNGFQWRGTLERLSAYRRCIAPDFLGLPT
jgi:pimeloyl-ACP methyl ester carboxylesterase